MRGLDVECHDRPVTSPTIHQFEAINDTPLSDFNVYVISFLYPIALAARHAAEYNIEQAFLVPFVQHRLTSNVQPSHNIRATGLPIMATPTIPSPSDSPMENL